MSADWLGVVSEEETAVDAKRGLVQIVGVPSEGMRASETAREQGEVGLIGAAVAKGKLE